MSAIEDKNDTKHKFDQVDKLAPLAVGDQKLERHMGYFSGTIMNVGEIIGSGIFSNPSYIIQNCGSGGMMLMLWLIGALTACTGLFSYLELGTMLPRSGGEKTYLGYIYPHPRQLLSFLFMILVGISVRCGSAAQSAIVFGDNMVYAIYAGQQKNEWASRGFGVFCLTFWVIVNIISAKNSIRFNNVFTSIKIMLLITLICVGFAGMAGRLPNQPSLQQNFSFQGTVSNPGSYANAVYFVIYAYSGYTNLQKVTDELKDPLKNLPRCGITAVGFTAVVYILANCAYLAVLPIEVIKKSELTVASNLFNTAFGFGGIIGSRIMPLFVGIASFGLVGVMTYSSSRLMLEFAREGLLLFDRFFSKVHAKLNTPVRALILFYVLSLVYLLAPPPGTVFEFIVAFNSYGEYFFEMLCAVGIFILRYREPNIERPFRAPKVFVLFYIVVCLFTIIFVFIPPTYSPAAYPYYVPYICWIVFALLCIIPWYIKMILYNGLENSYNHDIRKLGQQELVKEVYHNSDSSDSSILRDVPSLTHHHYKK